MVGLSTVNGFAKSGFGTAVPQVVTILLTCKSASPCGAHHRGIAASHHREHRIIAAFIVAACIIAASQHHTTTPPHHREHGIRTPVVKCPSPRGRPSLPLRSFASKELPDFNFTRTGRRESTCSPLRAVARTESERREASRSLLQCCTSCPGDCVKHRCSCRRPAGSYIGAVGFRRNSFGSPSNSGASSAARSSDVTNVTPGRLTTSSELTP